MNSRWKILVVDEHSHAMLKSVLSTFDILEEGVQRKLITQEQLETRRTSLFLFLIYECYNLLC